MYRLIKKKQLSSYQLIILSFFAFIIAGCLLLMLPVSAQSGKMTPFSEALFTATSAVCVTGLIVQDTATYWSTFGQTVILCLIQTGGLGAITIALTIMMFSDRKIGLMQRQTMQEAISAPQLGGIVRFTGFILRTVFAVEILGALLLSPVFIRDLGMEKGIWYSIFHSISAFCNAGFDLMGIRQAFSSVTCYSNNFILNSTIMFLIVFGGIGFLTWDDIFKKRLHVNQYRMQSKVILTTSIVLILIPAIYFFAIEFEGYKLGDRILLSLFQSVTTRTAGFNTADLTSLSDSGILLMCILMLIGGSPGSTAGGIKTTTFAVLLLTSFAVFRHQETVTCFNRRIRSEVIRKTLSLLTIYLTLSVGAAAVISSMEGIPILWTFFETCSALGTVGLTLGITPSLGPLSRSILIVLMFLGRVGCLTFIYAFVSDGHQRGKQYPKEMITVG